MTNQQRIAQLEVERDKRRATIRQHRMELNREETALRNTRQGGNNIAALEAEIRRQEIMLEGIEFDLERLRKPQPIILPQKLSSHEDDHAWLTRIRSEITHKRDYRHRQHEQQVEHIMRRYSQAPEAHQKLHFDNHFSATEQSRKQADADDQRLIDEIDRRLAALEPEAMEAAS